MGVNVPGWLKLPQLHAGAATWSRTALGLARPTAWAIDLTNITQLCPNTIYDTGERQ
jgi:hypothetical protein